MMARLGVPVAVTVGSTSVAGVAPCRRANAATGATATVVSWPRRPVRLAEPDASEWELYP
jgi:antitoxin (DNA-binding transcriptional repressor) of toxin-antitoxin stability system